MTIAVRQAEYPDLLLVATYLYYSCKQVQPVYYFGTLCTYNTVSCVKGTQFETYQLLRIQNQPCGQHLYYEGAPNKH